MSAVQTHQQDVVRATNQLAQLRDAYMSDLAAYRASLDPPMQRLPLVLKVQQSGNAYFNFAEDFVANSDLLGAHECVIWAQGFAENCAAILESYPMHFDFLLAAFRAADPNLDRKTIQPTSTAFANMQRMVVRYLTDEKRVALESAFLDAGLPIYGFENEAKVIMSKNVPKPFDHTTHLKTATPVLIVAMIIAAIAGIACVLAGIYALHQNSLSQTEIKLYDATLSTGQTGVALTFIGLVVLGMIIRSAIARTKPPKGI